MNKRRAVRYLYVAMTVVLVTVIWWDARGICADHAWWARWTWPLRFLCPVEWTLLDG